VIGNMYNWAFPAEHIAAVNATHRAQADALQRIAQATGATRQAPSRAQMARLIRALLRSLRPVPRPRFQP
jgi:uncharacterized membrane protein YqiK